MFFNFSFCHCEEQRQLRRGNLAERNVPEGRIPTVTAFPRNDRGVGHPRPLRLRLTVGFPRSLRSHGMTRKKWNLPFCHCEEQRELRRGNLAERNVPEGWIPTVTAFPRNDKGKMESSVFVIARSNESCDVAISRERNVTTISIS